MEMSYKYVKVTYSTQKLGGKVVTLKNIMNPVFWKQFFAILEGPLLLEDSKYRDLFIRRAN